MGLLYNWVLNGNWGNLEIGSLVKRERVIEVLQRKGVRKRGGSEERWRGERVGEEMVMVLSGRKGGRAETVSHIHSLAVA